MFVDIGILQGWHVWTELQFSRDEHVPVDEFRTLTRDLYIPANGVGIWQGALRDSSHDLHSGIAVAVAERIAFSVDLGMRRRQT